MEKEMLLQKGFDVVKLEERCELVNAASADWSILMDSFFKSEATAAAPEIMY